MEFIQHDPDFLPKIESASSALLSFFQTGSLPNSQSRLPPRTLTGSLFHPQLNLTNMPGVRDVSAEA